MSTAAEDLEIKKAQWKADARKARREPVYVCFEEPSDPLIWTAKDPSDPTWGGTADGDYPAKTCAWHLELGCGWYRLVEADT